MAGIVSVLTEASTSKLQVGVISSKISKASIIEREPWLLKGECEVLKT